MLDHFLTVAYKHQVADEQTTKLAHALKKLPNSTLLKLAAGTMKLSFMNHDQEWLDKYKGTPLFEEAMALEKADLEAEVSRLQAQQARPDMEQFHQTQDQIRMQKKMLDLKLVELQEQGGMPMKPGGELQTEVTPTAQGAGAMGDVPMEGVQDSVGGTVGSKTGSVIGKVAAANFEKAALTMADVGQFASSAGKQLTRNPARVGALVGAGVGAAGGAMAGGEGHRLSGALGGATLGAGIGHAGAGIGSRMMGDKAVGLGDAVKRYARGVKGGVQEAGIKSGLLDKPTSKLPARGVGGEAAQIASSAAAPVAAPAAAVPAAAPAVSAHPIVNVQGSMTPVPSSVSTRKVINVGGASMSDVDRLEMAEAADRMAKGGSANSFKFAAALLRLAQAA